jgi:DNA-binding NarL/FixJ family response regulator
LRHLVLVADADEEARENLARLLEQAGFEVVAASTGEHALAIARESFPSLAILEVPLGEMSGYEVCRTIREEHGEAVPVMFVSGARTESYDRVAGLSLGADDYLTKPYAPDELLARVRRLLRGPGRTGPQATTRLTGRELEVLRLLAEGHTPYEIAHRLFITKKTVATHVEHIFAKLGVHSRVEAVAVAYREGLVIPAA